jgi:hypothetical protein
MAVGYFTDKDHKPTGEELHSALGAAWTHWECLISYIAEKFAIPAEMTFGGKNYGWNLWYRKGGKSLVTLYPHKDSFIAQVVLGKDQVGKALFLELGENVGGVLRNTPQLHDGRWLFITAQSERDVADIQQLLTIKRKPVKVLK